MKIIIRIALLFIAFQTSIATGLAQGYDFQRKLWSSLGSEESWQDTKFLLFSCSGNDNSNLLNSETERSLLWNRVDGSCRFEGRSKKNEQIVYLFNFTTRKPFKLFINAVETAEMDASLLQDIYTQINEDLCLLLLPTIAGSKGIRFSEPTVKLVNNEKLLRTTVNYDGDFFNSPLHGSLWINEHSGQISTFEDLIKNVTYQIDQYKDTGSGLRLPTSFMATNNKKKSCTFTTVSTFEHVEPSKFTDL